MKVQAPSTSQQAADSSANTNAGFSTSTTTNTNNSSTNNNTTTTGGTTTTQSGATTDTVASTQGSSGTRIAQQSNTTTQTLSPEAAERRTQTSGTGYEGNAGIEYRGAGRYQNYNVPISDIGLLRSIVFSYFYLNDVDVTLDPENPNIEAIVTVNVDVFGSIRSRMDTLIYNKEQVKVQTVLEVFAIDLEDKALLMLPQTGGYEAVYDEKYLVWIGPINRKTKRMKHHPLQDGLLVDFKDLGMAKIKRDQQRE
ncbi:MAG: hypothetical protein GKR96_06515 [Gammaproteobacteria bacterium]|nr:hypothetical protein [Gammaproteobacteria bacterium]